MKLKSLLLLLGACPWTSSEPTVASLTLSLQRLESVREIKNVQKHFAQLAQYGRWAEMASLFSDNGILRWGSINDPLSDSVATTVTGPQAIEKWLRQDAGKMDGIQPGSLHVLINDQPMISLSDDGTTAKGRWFAMKLLGDGAGATRIEGGIFENQYIKENKNWQISLLRYYPIYHGNYQDGYKNAGPNNSVPIIPYHFTPETAGLSLLAPDNATLPNNSAPFSPSELEYRISRLNEEDEVRNLVHTMGYLVDRRLWPSVISLFTPNGTITVQGNHSSPPGPLGIQSVLSRMGPENLSPGILNEHPIFGTIISLSPDLKSATARGLEIGLIGNHSAKAGQWQFCTFRHTLVKSPLTGTWKIQNLNYTRLIFADYATGWGNGGIFPPSNSTPTPPPFFSLSPPPLRPANWTPFFPVNPSLPRSSAYDESESVSSAYGNYADDILCGSFALLHAKKGFKLSPGIGWYLSPEKISLACSLRYYNSSSPFYDPTLTPTRLRSSVPLHWRIQPVILASQDGKSVTLRTKLLQTGSSRVAGSSGWNGGMYHDQLVLEENRRKIWCLTIDEFYWTSKNWTSGWAAVEPMSQNDTVKNVVKRQGNEIRGLQPDVDLLHPKLFEREEGFNGGPGKTVSWPAIQRMWWPYRHLVTGNVSEDYWGPGCVPCRGAKPDWLLTANGYQEPPTGPTEVKARLTENGKVEVTVVGGPEEKASGGIVQLRIDMEAGEAGLLSSGVVGSDGSVTLTVTPENLSQPKSSLAVYYLGNNQLKPGRTNLGTKKV
ncbi:SnoaL-like domain-containing protein [Podospora fimiseda]|uniref:SnoaL-like domain-containing protein n=1 Tax=Podospora fimiseda TaxID=252190 RepID=A0AAN7GT65_9PEZI|nr:SnoaL-like domain-containing protein [Podospora fimiseda]